MGQLKESSRIAYHRVPTYKYRVSQEMGELVFFTGICPLGPCEHPLFSLSAGGTLTVKPGYAWDGATGGKDTKSIMRASLAHDVLYQMHQLEMPLPADWKEKADRLFKRLGREDGMWRIRGAWTFAAVHLFGRGNPQDLNKFRETLYAP